MRGIFLIGLILAGAGPTAAAAQSPANECFSTDAGTSVDLRIAGCTDIIQSGALPQDSLAVALQNRGTAYLNKGEFDLAIQDYDQAIALIPAYANAFNSRGVAYQAKGENERALEDYDQAIRLEPDNANALNGRCWLQAVRGELQAALADCDESLRLRPNSSNTLDSRAFVYIRLGRWDEALADSDAALRANPGNAWALFERGVAKRRKGDSAGGDADIAASRGIDPKAEMELASFGVQ
jgi:tetratricopeptide (TPR) repeat protein